MGSSFSLSLWFKFCFSSFQILIWCIIKNSSIKVLFFCLAVNVLVIYEITLVQMHLNWVSYSCVVYILCCSLTNWNCIFSSRPSWTIYNCKTEGLQFHSRLTKTCCFSSTCVDKFTNSNCHFSNIRDIYKLNLVARFCNYFAYLSICCYGIQDSYDLHFCTKNVVLCTLAVLKRFWQSAHNIWENIFGARIFQNLVQVSMKIKLSCKLLQGKMLLEKIGRELESMCINTILQSEGQMSVFEVTFL